MEYATIVLLIIFSVILLLLIFWLVFSYIRNKKYPLAKGYRIYNKIIIPAPLVSHPIVYIINYFLKKIKIKPIVGIEKEIKYIKTEDEYDLKLSVYKPINCTSKRCIIDFHGGGFVFNSVKYLHILSQQYALNSNSIVIFVEYRTSDRNPFPTSFNDACCAISYIYNHQDEFKIDKNKIILMGDSVGGNLVAATSFYCREHNIKILYQMMYHPMLDVEIKSESCKQFKYAPLCSVPLIKKAWKTYIENEKDESNKMYYSPLYCNDFSSLPNAYIEVCQYDALRDDGIRYFQKLKDASIDVKLEIIENTCHGFDSNLKGGLTKTYLEKRYQILNREFEKAESK